jgi:Outer membrane protein beta-barrel family/TonB-dependent Receptor Plug Domain
MAMQVSRGMVLATVALAVRVAMAQAAVPAVDDAGTDVEVVGPGALTVLDELVVQGKRDVNIQQATTQVVSVLSSEDIARTGEGDIAGALARITGLSVVGGGLVYVRGLGDRYSLALLNGSPLPSPEPLRRAVPLDLFPTDIIASSMVQKTYSPNYTGEFGGGVINLTTLAIPKAPFLKVNAGIGGDSESTNRLGYDHYGSRYDWTGYNAGLRGTPPALAAFLSSGQRLSAGGADEQAIAGELAGWRNAAVQKLDGLSPNYSTSLTGGNTWVTGSGAEFGLIATGGFDNKWRTRDNTEQTPASADLAFLATDYRSVASENRIVTNGMLGLGYQMDQNQLRWTNLYVHDTLKRTSLAEGTNSQNPDRELRKQDTAWYERQVLSTQLAGSLQLDPVRIDARASRSQSRRNAPYELGIGYSRSNDAGSPYGAYFINGLDNGATGYATVAFSKLTEDLSSAGVDVTWRLMPGVVLSGGYDYAYTARDTSRREFQILNPGTSEWADSGVFLLRPDYLLSPQVIDHYGMGLIESTEEDPAFAARLLVHGVYSQVQAQLMPGLELSAGARLERGKEVVRPKQVFTTPPSGISNRINEDYLLPAATLTWKLGEAQQQQVRLNVSKTIARPQFRELMAQAYFDPENNRTYRGNPLLTDSEFLNAEARYEWYFAPEQRFSAATFYKKIDRPIEVQTSLNDNNPVSSFANAPEATLYGAEVELQKHFALADAGFLGEGRLGNLIGARRLVTILNYTWTNSDISVKAGDRVRYYTPAQQDWDANLFFRDGSRLTGQSNHLVNLQFGLEHPGKLSQQTVLLSYASDRITSRGPVGSNFPDIRESPGLRLDFVARQGLELFGQEADAKFEARNLLGRGYREFQKSGDNIVYFNKYDIGRSFSLSLTFNF